MMNSKLSVMMMFFDMLLFTIEFLTIVTVIGVWMALMLRLLAFLMSYLLHDNRHLTQDRFMRTCQPVLLLFFYTLPCYMLAYYILTHDIIIFDYAQV